MKSHYIRSLYRRFPAHIPDDRKVIHFIVIPCLKLHGGDLWNFIWQNVTLGQKASLLWAVGAGRYVQTCGLFMLGMLIGRRKLFISSEENSRFWIKTLIITAIAFGPLYQLKVLLMDTADSAIVRQTAGVVLEM